jgi:hypothetical protein
MAFNLLTLPQVRLLLGTRCFDFRPLLAGLSDAERDVLWGASRIRNMRVRREGHHVRSADDFNKHIASFAS